MNQDSFKKVCTTPAHKILIGGSAGSGKSCMAFDLVVNFLHENYRQDLDCGALNDLHSILNAQIPVVVITDEPPYNVLLKLSNNLIKNSLLSDVEKIQRVDNLCKVYSTLTCKIDDNWLEDLKQNLQRYQTKLMVVDGGFPEISPETLFQWSREYDLAIIQTVQNYRSAPSYSGGKQQMAGPVSHMRTSDIAVMLAEPIKSSNNNLKFEVTLLKNRFGTAEKEFIYECFYSPY